MFRLYPLSVSDMSNEELDGLSYYDTLTHSQLDALESVSPETDYGIPAFISTLNAPVTTNKPLVRSHDKAFEDNDSNLSDKANNEKSPLRPKKKARTYSFDECTAIKDKKNKHERERRISISKSMRELKELLKAHGVKAHHLHNKADVLAETTKLLTQFLPQQIQANHEKLTTTEPKSTLTPYNTTSAWRPHFDYGNNKHDSLSESYQSNPPSLRR